MKNRVQRREKVSGANQRLNRVKEEDMTPAMPRPLSRRPATAMGRLWAVAKRKPPRAATRNWQLSRRRGPKRVERMPMSPEDSPRSRMTSGVTTVMATFWMKTTR